MLSYANQLPALAIVNAQTLSSNSQQECEEEHFPKCLLIFNNVQNAFALLEISHNTVFFYNCTTKPNGYILDVLCIILYTFPQNSAFDNTT